MKKQEFTLSTEAQWEYACRAGTTTAIAFGNRISASQANLRADSFYYNFTASNFRKVLDKLKFKFFGTKNQLPVTKPVGSYKPNAWRIYDMHGNVLEWCLDWHEDAMHAERGGAANRTGSSCRSASRILKVIVIILDFYKMKKGGCFQSPLLFC